MSGLGVAPSAFAPSLGSIHEPLNLAGSGDLDALTGGNHFRLTESTNGAPDLGIAYDALGWQSDVSGQRTQYVTAGPNHSLYTRTDDGGGTFSVWARMAQVIAWARFNGSSMGIEASENITGITRNSTGNYTVNFAGKAGNDNYVALVNARDNSTGDYQNCFASSMSHTANSVRVITANDADGSFRNAAIINVAILR